MPGTSSSSGFTYRAFISYSHRDKAWADWLHKALETYRVPARLVGQQTEAGTVQSRLNPIFRDREELASASELGTRINAALAASENLIVICSPASAVSHWVDEEVLAWRRLGRGERIFCLIVAGEPNASHLPGRESEECFCPALRFKLGANGQPTTERTEPIAADARPGKDGKANAKLKLIAGMLGVSFDALKQREQHRRMRWMAAVTGVATIVMGITLALAVFALIARHQAVIAEHRAQIAQQAAQRRQKQAEGLVNFMLGDLNDELQAIDRLSVMKAVDDKAMGYFQSLPDSDVSDIELAQRAKALEKIGTVRSEQGQWQGALDAYAASTRISSKLAAEAPASVTRQIAYSRTLAFIGVVHWNQDDLGSAQQVFETGQHVLRAAIAHVKGNADLLFQLYALDEDIGHVTEARGQLVTAEAGYRQALTAIQGALALSPNDVDYASELANAHDNLGHLAVVRGDLASAIGQYTAENEIDSRLTALHPKDNAQRENTLIAYAILGRTLASTGDMHAGTADLQQAVAMASQLTKADPTQPSFSEDLALYSAQLSRLERLTGDTTAANIMVTRSVTILSKLIRGSTGSGYRRDYAIALIEQAALSRAAGKAAAAQALLRKALRILEPMRSKEPRRRGLLLTTMDAELSLANSRVDPQTARSLREQALTTLQAQKFGKNDPRLLALQVETLMALGQEPQTKPLVRQLWHEGYRDPALVHVLQRAQIAYPPNQEFHAHLLASALRVGRKRLPQGIKLHP